MMIGSIHRIKAHDTCTILLIVVLVLGYFHVRPILQSHETSVTEADQSRTTFPFWKQFLEDDDNFIRDVCLFYDRPPRTGSSTISSALDTCWAEKLQAKSRKHIPKHILDAFNHTTNNGFDDFLELQAPVVSHHSWHCVIDDHHIVRLKKSCRQLFYLSSTRDKRSRILSIVKHSMTGNKRELNGTVPIEQFREQKSALVQEIQRRDVTGPIYPFRGVLRMTPDYVIRNDHFESDLSQLLAHFGCPSNFTSINVHHTSTTSSAPDSQSAHSSKENVTDEVDKLFEDVHINEVDPFHERLSLIAEMNNVYGLQKASWLASYIQSLNRSGSL